MKNTSSPASLASHFSTVLSRRTLVASIAFAGAIALELFTPLAGFAHGWIVSPPSRQDHCAARRTAFDCGDIQYEPQSVEGLKGSQLCSGGSRFGILDSPGPWPITAVGGTVTFTWQLTAPHRTSTWEYFIDGRLIQSFDQGNQVPPSTVTHTISGLPSGPQTILAVWNVADTLMAFYGCVDVFVEGN